jgi:hypothetical protein
MTRRRPVPLAGVPYHGEGGPPVHGRSSSVPPPLGRAVAEAIVGLEAFLLKRLQAGPSSEEALIYQAVAQHRKDVFKAVYRLLHEGSTYTELEGSWRLSNSNRPPSNDQPPDWPTWSSNPASWPRPRGYKDPRKGGTRQ